MRQELIDGLIEGFTSSVHSAAEDVPDGDLQYKAAVQLGERAALYAVAPLVWASAIGDCFDTKMVISLLGITRQAIAKRVASRTMLGIPSRGTTLFPVWQFDPAKGTVRRVVPDLLEEWNHEGIDPLDVAVWARTPQTEDLEGLSPSEWIEKGQKEATVVTAARRAALALAQ